MQSYNIAHISGAASTQVVTGSCNLHTINISVPFTTSITVYDNIGTDITNPIFSALTGTGCFIIDGRLANGLKIVTVGATGEVTVTYNS